MKLKNYRTGETIREATAAEIAESNAEIDSGRPEGLIVVDGTTCYVE